MAYKKQGNSRDDKSADATRKYGKPASGRRSTSSPKNENTGEEGSFRKKPSAFGAPKKSFGPARGNSAEKRFSGPSTENNRFKSRDNSNASFTGKKSEDAKPFRKPAADRPFESAKPFRKASTTGKPFNKEGGFAPKRSSDASRDKPFSSGKPFKSRSNDDFKDFRSEKPSFKSSNSEGRPYEKDFSAKPKRTRTEETTGDAPRKPVMRSRNKSEGKIKDDGLIRLNRYIANAGICSRRKADELIAAGVVSVNGEVVAELGAKIDPIKDVIRYNGETLKREKMVYVLLNKPKDYITTTDDPQERRTVMQLVEKASRERIYPVGRLDRNTTGLLLMTNDGDLADKLSHPRSNVTKIYNIELDKSLTQGDLNKIAFGLELEDGLIKPDTVTYVQGGTKREVGIQIHSGKNRIVRRIFEHLGYEVVKLDRVIYANLTKKDLTRGRWRYLEEKEIIQLKHLIK